MLNNSRTSALISTLVKYAVNNMNDAVEVLDRQRDDFDDNDDFYQEILESSTVELDDFVLGMATSEPYVQDTIEELQKKGYEIVDPDDVELSSLSPIKLAKDLIHCVGKRRAITLIMDL